MYLSIRIDLDFEEKKLKRKEILDIICIFVNGGFFFVNFIVMYD